MLRRKVPVLLRQYRGNRYNMSIKWLSSFVIFIITLYFWSIALAGELYDRALQKYKAGEFTEAINLLIQIPSKGPGDYNLLGWAFLRSGNTGEAIKQFELSLSFNPNLYDSYCGLGYSYYQQSIFEKALENFNKYISQTRKDTNCLLGFGLTLERLQQKEKALEVFKEILSIDRNNLLAVEKINILSPQMEDNSQKEGIKFFAKGNYFWIKLSNNKIEPIFIKGVNLGFALPGKFPSEFPEDEKLYLEWFKLIGEMKANLIRVYTILPPQFYSTFKKYNQNKKEEERLFLIQGIWAELPEKSNFRDPEYLNETRKEIKNAIDVIHGNANIPHRYGHAYGLYRTDISDYVLGFIFGREWEPPEVIAYNKLNFENSFNGKYLSINNGNPMEVWLTEMLDYLISYEYDQYKTQRPVAFMNWPPLDPLYHQSEAALIEEVEFRKKTGEIIGDINYSMAFDEDVVSLDETKIIVDKKYKAGIFASSHVYPYYPDFLRNEEKYSKESFPKGSNYYYNYLTELKNYYKEIPLLISEFGIPTSRGIARFHPEGLHHGGHNENEQADILKRLILSIKEAQCAGGIVFSWIDEWSKTNWMVRKMEESGLLWFNAQDPEESYGLIGMLPIGTKEKLMGKPSAWNTSTLIYSKDSKFPSNVLRDDFDEARNIRRVYADADAGYLYLRIDVDGKIDWGKVAYLIAIDTIGDKEGDHKFPFNLDFESPIGFEYMVLLHGKRSRILIDDVYNRMTFDPDLLRLPGLSGYKENKSFRSAYNRNGLFTEIVTTHRRRFSRDGKVFPEKIYNASILKEGNLSDDTLADFYYSEENNFFEIRIPWNLLNVSDPSQLQIIYSKDEKKITNGLRIMVASYKPLSKDNSNASELQYETNITDIVPQNLSGIKYYRWQGWESPEYIMRPKKSYHVMKEVFENIRIPEIKINLPPGFDFTSVIKNHYGSIEEFLKSYEVNNFNTEDSFGLALAYLVNGLVRNEPFYILEAKSLFSHSYNTSTDSRERKVSQFGLQYIENILSGDYKKASDAKDALEQIYIEKQKLPTKDFKKIIIGKSAIRLNKNPTIKTQVDRVTRDWLSAFNGMTSPRNFSYEKTVPWHEGEKIKELIDFTDAKVFPIWGTKVKKFGDSWYAPDADGTYRFILSEDKVYNYPTNIIIDEGAVIINDSHGISAIAWDSLDADLIVGCGDHEGKVDAAYYLAKNGVNVYMPTDRFLNVLIGTNTKGVIIGSAPVKKTVDGAVIGDQPISIDVNEPIVVSNSDGGYPLQYYDTPYRYFKELERYVGRAMNIIPVNITEYGKGGFVVEEARRIGAKLIGVRVWGKEEHDIIYSWLREDKARRAVLFHSAVYPEGYRLFFEFPEQTSFGDINVYFE